ncbi:MAG: iron-containing alcohol dehydrogenase [Cocleimonas sp.]
MNLESLTGNWNYPTAIRFGCGRINELADACHELGMSRPLLITDQGIAALPIVSDAVEVCKKAGMACGVFSDIQANPIGKNVDDGVVVYKQGSHDGVIAFGGGSALDVAKAVALMVGQDRPLWDFEDVDDWCTRVNVDGMAPVVAVPTTSGTGSEVGRASVITDESNHTKKIIFHANMLPEKVICDPQLTVGLPKNITAWVGMDALSHSMEAYFSPFYHPMAEGIALKGMKLVKDFLPNAVSDGTDLVARSQMMIASTMGATAFQKGLGAMHSLSHPCGALLNTQHGLTNAVVMPYVLERNREAISGKAIDLARFLNLPNPSLDSLLKWVLELREQVEIPHTLADIGVNDSHIEELSKMAAVDPTVGGNPIFLDVDDMAKLYDNAISGNV